MILPVETALSSLPLADVVLRFRDYGEQGLIELMGDSPVFVLRPQASKASQAHFNTPAEGMPLPDTRQWTGERDMYETQPDEFFIGWAGFDAKSPVIPVVKSERNPFTGVVTVGRALNNDIRLASPCVSKLHAFLRKTESGWTVQDSNSSNGVYVNACRLEPNVENHLRPGDELRLANITGAFLDLAGLQALCQIIRF